MEIWKSLDGILECGEKYEVSNLGKVRNRITGHVLKPGFSGDHEYLQVSLSNSKVKRYLLHRVVAIAFIPNPENKPEVNHKDGDKTNCAVDNLEWVTSSENQIHATVNGLQRPQSKLTADDVREIRELSAKGYSQRKLANMFGLGKGTVQAILQGRSWSYVK